MRRKLRNPHFFQKCCHFCWNQNKVSKNDKTVERNEDCATVFSKWMDFITICQIFLFIFWKNLRHQKYTFSVHIQHGNMLVSSMLRSQQNCLRYILTNYTKIKRQLKSFTKVKEKEFKKIAGIRCHHLQWKFSIIIPM